MNCPNCQSPRNRISATRPFSDEIRRNRVCLDCQHTWLTIERCYNPDELVMGLTQIPRILAINAAERVMQEAMKCVSTLRDSA